MIHTIQLAELQDENILEKVSKHILNHGVIIYPTDTLYGLGGRFDSPQAIETIDKLKQRQNSPYSVAVSQFEMLSSLTESIPEVYKNHLHPLLPGKFTFLFPAKSGLEKNLLKGSTKIGIRIPDIPPILNLIQHLNYPLITTSVNLAGTPPLNDPKEIVKSFITPQNPQEDIFLIDGGPISGNLGSTIIDLTETPIRILRKGADLEKLEKLKIEWQGL